MRHEFSAARVQSLVDAWIICEQVSDGYYDWFHVYREDKEHLIVKHRRSGNALTKSEMVAIETAITVL